MKFLEIQPRNGLAFKVGYKEKVSIVINTARNERIEKSAMDLEEGDLVMIKGVTKKLPFSWEEMRQAFRNRNWKA